MSEIKDTGKICPKVKGEAIDSIGQLRQVVVHCGTHCPLCKYEPDFKVNGKITHKGHFTIYCGCEPVRINEETSCKKK